MNVLERESTLHQAERFVWHHGVQDATYFERNHRILRSGKGVHVEDLDGRTYIDGTSGQAVVLIGHGREEMADAIAEQVRTIAFAPLAFGFSHPYAAALAQQLAEITPGSLERTFFACSGSEANDTAIKIARQAQARRGEATRKKIIARRGSYHGVTYGALSATATTRLREPSEPLVGGFRHIAQPYPTTCAFCQNEGTCTLACADDLQRCIEFEGPSTVAAFIAEPIATPEAIKVPAPGYWERIADICRGYGVFLIADEVFVGFGRTGRLFASEHFGIEPEIMTMSKGLTSGYVPLSAAIATREIAALFDSPEHAFQHAGTYSGHPVACAAAMKNIEIIHEEGLIENARRQGERLESRLGQLAGLPFVRAVTVIGLLIGVELTAAGGHATPSVVGPFIRDRAFENGLICRYVGPSICLYPPLILSDAESDQLADILLEAFDAAAGRFGGKA